MDASEKISVPNWLRESLAAYQEKPVRKSGLGRGKEAFDTHKNKRQSRASVNVVLTDDVVPSAHAATSLGNLSGEVYP